MLGPWKYLNPLESFFGRVMEINQIVKDVVHFVKGRVKVVFDLEPPVSEKMALEIGSYVSDVWVV